MRITEQKALLLAIEQLKSLEPTPLNKQVIAKLGEMAKAKTAIRNDRTKEEWLAEFAAEFNRIKPRSSREYNAKRSSGTPTWNTIADYCRTGTWTNLIKISGVSPESLLIKCKYNKPLRIKERVEPHTEIVNECQNKHAACIDELLKTIESEKKAVSTLQAQDIKIKQEFLR